MDDRCKQLFITWCQNVGFTTAYVRSRGVEKHVRYKLCELNGNIMWHSRNIAPVWMSWHIHLVGQVHGRSIPTKSSNWFIDVLYNYVWYDIWCRGLQHSHITICMQHLRMGGWDGRMIIVSVRSAANPWHIINQGGEGIVVHSNVNFRLRYKYMQVICGYAKTV